MKKTIKLLFTLILPCGLALSSVPLIETSCSTNRIKITTSKKTLAYGETVTIKAKVGSKISHPITWQFPVIDGVKFTEAGVVGGNSKLYVTDVNKTELVLDVMNIFARSHDNKIRSNKITLHLKQRPAPTNVASFLLIADKMSCGYLDTIKVQAIQKYGATIDPSSISFNITGNDTSYEYVQDIEDGTKTLIITNKNRSPNYSVPSVNIAVLDLDDLIVPSLHLHLQGVQLSCNAPNLMKAKTQVIINARVSDSNFVVQKYKWCDDAGNNLTNTSLYTIEYLNPSGLNESIKFTNTNYSEFGPYLFGAYLRAYDNVSESQYIQERFEIELEPGGI